MAEFQPPPTYALPVITDEVTGLSQFNPIWLDWFLRLAAVISAAGGGGGALLHNLLGGLQGGAAAEYYHLTAAQHTDITGGGSFKTIEVAGEDDVVAASFQDILTLVGGGDLTITTDGITKTITFTAVSSGGDVTGPASSGDGNVTLFDGLTGKIIKDGGAPSAFVSGAGYWSPLTDGDLTAAELIFADGDTISVWTPT